MTVQATCHPERKHQARGLCAPCYTTAQRNGQLDVIGRPVLTSEQQKSLYYQRKFGSTSIPDGTRRDKSNGYVEIRANNRWVMEHRYVMEINLGRELVTGENVHHINGIRNDNRIDNLELWYSPQPYGQRVSQLLDYIVKTYPEELRTRLKETT